MALIKVKNLPECRPATKAYHYVEPMPVITHKSSEQQKKPPRIVTKAHPASPRRWTEEEDKKLKHYILEGMRVDDIAALMGRPVGTVKHKHANMRKSMRSKNENS